MLMEKLYLTILGKAGYDALKNLFSTKRSEIDKAFDLALDRTKEWYVRTYGDKYGKKNERFFDYRQAEEELEKLTFFLPDPDVNRITEIKLKWKESVPDEVVVAFVEQLKREMGKERTLDAVLKEQERLFQINRIVDHTGTTADNTHEMVKIQQQQLEVQHGILEAVKPPISGACDIDNGDNIGPLDWKKLEEAFIKRKLDKVTIKQIGEGKSGPDMLALEKVFFEQHVRAHGSVSFSRTENGGPVPDYFEKFGNCIDLWQSYLWRYMEEHHLAGRRSRSFSAIEDEDEKTWISKCLEIMAGTIQHPNHEISAAAFAKAVGSTAKTLNKAPLDVVQTLSHFLMETHREPLLACLTPPCNAILIGDAGTGKTTAMSKLCLERFHHLATGADETPIIPIFVRLDAVAGHLKGGPIKETADSLLSYVCAHWRDYLVQSGDLCVPVLRREPKRIQLILDGLDEIPSLEVRERLARAIHYLTSELHFNVLLTSRPAAVDQGMLDLLKLKEVHLLSLSVEQIEAFVRQFFMVYNGDAIEMGKADARAFSGALIEADAAREFAPNPLYLTVMMLMHKKHEVLPRRRVELYQEFINMLLSQRQSKPVQGKYGEKPVFKVDSSAGKPIKWQDTTYLKLLYRIAFLTHGDADDSVSVTHKRVISAMKENRRLLRQVPGKNETDLAREFIDFCDEKLGILVSRGPYSGFSHRSIQEFFSAMRLKDVDQGGIIKFWEENVLARPDRWGEVARLLFCLIWEKDIYEELEDRWPENIERAVNPKVIEVIGNALSDLEGFYPNFDGEINYLYENVKDALIKRRDASHGKPDIFLACSDALGLINEPDIDINDPPMGEFEASEPFQMGEEKPGEEKPVRPVRLSPYWMDKYPVTNKVYAEFIRQGGYTDERYWVDEDAVFGFDGRAFLKGSGVTSPEYWESDDFGKKQPLCPVVGISWFEAMAFCRWWTLTYGGTDRNRTNGPTGRLTARLPTEAEWEFAARGYERREFPWGAMDPEAIGIYANTRETKLRQMTTIGSFPSGATPDKTGLLDMAGNVWEWCFDFYKGNLSEEAPERDPVNIEKGEGRSLRGGSWLNFHGLARCAVRGNNGPRYRYDHLGFRCVRTLT